MTTPKDLLATHTYALLDIPQEMYDYIRGRMQDAGYEHAIGEGGELDMHGIALVVQEEKGTTG